MIESVADGTGNPLLRSVLDRSHLGGGQLNCVCNVKDSGSLQPVVVHLDSGLSNYSPQVRCGQANGAFLLI